MVDFIMWTYLIVAIIVGITGAIVASNKGRNGVGWFVLCFLIPIAILPLLALESAKTSNEKHRRDGRYPCPRCAEWIMRAAVICPHCDTELPKRQTH